MGNSFRDCDTGAYDCYLEEYAEEAQKNADLSRDALAGFSQKVLEKLQSDGTSGNISIPGNRPYKVVGGAGMVPKTGDACTQCGLCAAQCPAGAIDKEEKLS